MSLEQVMKMTDEEVNRGLAKAIGEPDCAHWKCQNCGGLVLLTYYLIHKDCGGFLLGIKPKEFTGSLDLLQPIKEGLSREQQRLFSENLAEILNDVNRGGFRWLGPTTYHYASATASQQSRALLAALMEEKV